ncbi:hypothetical protein D3C72_2198790 [compost metagenome]
MRYSAVALSLTAMKPPLEAKVLEKLPIMMSAASRAFCRPRWPRPSSPMEPRSWAQSTSRVAL